MTILSDRIAIYLISHISQILVKNVGMGNWVSWPLLKTFFSLKDNTVSRQRVPAAGTIHHRKSQNTLIYLIIIIESGSRSWKVFPYHFTHCLGGQWEHKTAQKRRMQRTRTSQTQQGAMPLLCFVLGSAKAAHNFLFATYTCFIRSNKLSPARHWVCLSQGKNCHCIVFCRDTAHRQSEPALAAGTSSDQPHCSLHAHF